MFSILLDLIFEEPPEKIHPVAFMGIIGKRLYKKYSNNLKYFIVGMMSLILEIAFWGILIYFIQKVNIIIIKNIILIYILKTTFSIKSLYRHVERCKTNDLNELKRNVSYIVSRNTNDLDKNHLYSAAIESLSENINDSITAPLFYYLLFGIYGSIIYRVVNTYDALFGYRNAKYEWYGKFCARLDDVLNYIPARITALIISFFNLKGAFNYIKKYGRIKVNSTYPMSAFAGVLGLGFEKEGVYKFSGKLPEIEDLNRALKLYKKVVFLILTFVILGEII
nr:adenosylcobinamide-phosphate synthase CbiB [Marinitoga sp. 38H-ov]